MNNLQTIKDANITLIGAEFLPTLSFNEWESFGNNILGVITSESTTWILGDWLLYGESSYGDKFYQAIPETFKPQTLNNAMCLCRAFPKSRRRNGLSASHHDAVKGLPIEEQDILLDIAEKENLSRGDLRSRVKAQSSKAKLTIMEHLVQVISKAGKAHGIKEPILSSMAATGALAALTILRDAIPNEP